MSEINNSVSVGITCIFPKLTFSNKTRLFEAACWTELSTEIALLGFNSTLIFVMVFILLTFKKRASYI
jgi:hypothetical protein